MDKWKRREILLAAGVGVIANTLAGQAAYAKQRVLTPAEQSNIKLVQDFLRSWDSATLDVDKLVAQYFAANASVRWTDDSPPAVGLAAAAAAAKAGMPPGAVVHIDLYDIWAHGPLVTTARLDTIKSPGKPDIVFKTAGVAVIHDGKFVEYCDYVIK